MNIFRLDNVLIDFFRKTSIPFARIALFVVFFWFGALKLLGLSPASPIAKALTEQTVGLSYFDELFFALAILECLIGLLFLVPKATKIVIPLLFLHLAVVCSPLVLVPSEVWVGFLTPTLEGQYIIKNILIVALGVVVAAGVKPFRK